MSDISSILARAPLTPAQRKYRWRALLAASGGGKVTPAIRLSGASLLENSAVDTFIGTLSVIGSIGTPTFTLVDSSSSKTKLTGSNILAGSSATNYETTPSFNIIVSVSGVTPAIANATFSINVTNVVEDTTPDAFSFTDVTGAALLSVIASNAVTITGVDGPCDVVLTGTALLKEYRINGGAWGTTGQISNGQTLEVRGASVGSALTAVTVIATVGGNVTSATADTFSITTGAGDVTAPTITSSASISLAENVALSHSLTANESVTWTKTGGADAALFTLVGSTLSMTAKDFESPSDADVSNTYLVQVTATDAALNATPQNITVTVTDADEVAPTITSSASVSQAENAILSHSLTANETVTWTKTGGLDAGMFTLAGSTLTLPAQDYEIPSDSNADRVYVVQVTATDTAGNATNQTISVTITDVSEGGGGTLTAPTLNLQAASDTGPISTDNITNLTSISFDVNAPDATVSDSVTWRLYKNGSLVDTTTTTGATVTFAGVSATAGTDNWTATYQVGANLSNVSANETVTVDTTAPTLSSPTGTKTGSTTATITVDVAETGGDLFWVADTNLTTPSGAQVVAGQDQGGAAADKSGSSLAIASTGTKTFNLTSLSGSTTYKGYFAYRDVAGNISTVAASASFTTDALGGSVTADNFQSTGATATSPATITGLTFTAGIAVIGIQIAGDTGADLTSVQITGLAGGTITATKVEDVHWGGVYYAAIPTGGTGSLVVTYAGVATPMAVTYGTIHGASATPYAHSGDANAPDPCTYIPINIPTNGIGLAFYGNYNAPNAPPYTWTGCDSTSSDTAIRIAGAVVSALNHKSGALTSWNPATAGFAAGGYNFTYLVSWGP